MSLVLATPADPKESEELTPIARSMRGVYGKGKWCPDPAKPDGCHNIDDVTRVLATSRNEAELRREWEGWHTISPPMRPDYARFAELSNKGAKELGFADTGAMWRAKYDMPPDAFTTELDRLWDQVRPLYLELHAYVRMKLREKYGDVVPANGPDSGASPRQHLGAGLVEHLSAGRAGERADAGYSLTDILKRARPAPLDMVRIGERFYTSLGFEPLPPTFWERSLFVRPRDREVVCHASAWDIDDRDRRAHQDVHRTDGRGFLDDPSRARPQLLSARLQGPAGPLPRQRQRRVPRGDRRHHRAVGHARNTSSRSACSTRRPDASRDIGLLMTRALEKVAFLPFGLLIDQWRWKVFSGEVTPAEYNKAWWALRLKYQGIAPPSPRGEEFFDPGAKYHVPDNTPYTRYFLADILQFQFHRALAKTAGCTTPLHRCSIYGSKEAGQRLNAMLAMGQSQPWPDALEALTGSKQMDASAIIDYFAPLKAWLDEQLKDKPVGW